MVDQPFNWADAIPRAGFDTPYSPRSPSTSSSSGLSDMSDSTDSDFEMVRQRWRLVTGDLVIGIMFEANESLSEGSPASVAKAIKLYTRILYQESPGHIPALLNRALAYIAAGYPELAVVDCHRVAQTIQQSRGVHQILQNKPAKERAQERERRGLPYALRKWNLKPASSSGSQKGLTTICQATYRYLHQELSRTKGNETWIAKPTCYVRRPFLRWLQHPMSSIALADNTYTKDMRPLFEALEARAMFRLAGALWHCGTGPGSDAQGIVEEVLNYQMNPKVPEQAYLTREELRGFRDLGNAILNDSLNKLSKLKTEKEKHDFKEQMRNKMTMVNRVIYPWSKHQPDLSDPDVGVKLVEMCDRAGKEITVSFNEATETSPHHTHLVADSEIKQGRIFLNEHTILQAATPGKEDPFKRRTNLKRCTVCHARVILPLFEEDNKHESSSYEEDSDDAMEVDEDISGPRGTQSGFQRLLSTFAVPKESELEDKLTKCPGCHVAYYCSAACKVAGVDTHEVFCASGASRHIKERLNWQHKRMASNEAQPEDSGDEVPIEQLGLSAEDEAEERERRWERTQTPYHPTAKHQYLVQHILLRILGIAGCSVTHPLELDEVMFLNGGLLQAPGAFLYAKHEEEDIDPARTYKPGKHARQLPWAYDSHVRLPIQLLANLGIDAWEQINSFDGWVLNTLFAKLDRSMRVVKGLQHSKVFDSEGKFVAGGIPGDAASQHEWVGLVHPVFSMMLQEAPGLKQNVLFVDRANVNCQVWNRDLYDSAGQGLPDALRPMADGEERSYCVGEAVALVRKADPCLEDLDREE